MTHDAHARSPESFTAAKKQYVSIRHADHGQCAEPSHHERRSHVQGRWHGAIVAMSTRVTTGQPPSSSEEILRPRMVPTGNTVKLGHLRSCAACQSACQAPQNPDGIAAAPKSSALCHVRTHAEQQRRSERFGNSEADI